MVHINMNSGGMCHGPFRLYLRVKEGKDIYTFSIIAHASRSGPNVTPLKILKHARYRIDNSSNSCSKIAPDPHLRGKGRMGCGPIM
jgi:hypothetical protein